MLPDEMEAEKNRKIIVSQADEIELLKKEIAQQQEQIYKLYDRIKVLNESQCQCDVST